MKKLLFGLSLFAVSITGLAETMNCDIVFNHSFGELKHKILFTDLKTPENKVLITTIPHDRPESPKVQKCLFSINPNSDKRSIECVEEDEMNIIKIQRYEISNDLIITGSISIDHTRAIEKGTVQKINPLTGVRNIVHEAMPIDYIKNCRIE